MQPASGLVPAGLSPDVREAGMFAALVSDGIAVLVVRGEDGVLRAFTNTCRHDDPYVAAERESPGQSTANAFTCPFADWPGTHAAGGRGVRPLPVVETHGVVIVSPGGAPVDAGALLDAGTARALDELGLDRYERTSAERSVSAASPSAVAEGFRASPGTLAIGDRAVVVVGDTRDADAPDVELRRAFALPTGETVVDIAQYTLRA